MKISRRGFLKGSLLASAGAAGVYGTKKGFDIDNFDLDLEIIELLYSNLPAELNGYRIGFISDIHLGPSMPFEFLQKCFKELEKQTVDLLLLGGDYIWIPESNFKMEYFPYFNNSFRNLNNYEMGVSAFQYLGHLIKKLSFGIPDGIFGVFGNHDRRENPEACKMELSQGQAKILVNQQHVIKKNHTSLTLYGTDDLLTGSPTLPEFTSNFPNSFNILLTHNPDFISRVVKRYYLTNNNRYNFHLSLGGHTHGGQIKLPLIGAPIYNVKDKTYKEGFVSIRDNSFSYTTRGVGTVELPIRINCKPEVNIFILKLL